jgi:hypothetical protein
MVRLRGEISGTAPDRQLSLAPTGNFACPVLSLRGLGYRDLAVFP